MAYARIVTNKKGTVVRNLVIKDSSCACVDQAAATLASIICEERDILHVEVDYEGCDDSKTIERYNP